MRSKESRKEAKELPAKTGAYWNISPPKKQQRRHAPEKKWYGAKPKILNSSHKCSTPSATQSQVGWLDSCCMMLHVFFWHRAAVILVRSAVILETCQRHCLLRACPNSDLALPYLVQLWVTFQVGECLSEFVPKSTVYKTFFLNGRQASTPTFLCKGQLGGGFWPKGR